VVVWLVAGGLLAVSGATQLMSALVTSSDRLSSWVAGSASFVGGVLMLTGATVEWRAAARRKPVRPNADGEATP
jgi:TRAP-type C4-dicarboxylate transport system permease small subunit